VLSSPSSSFTVQIITMNIFLLSAILGAGTIKGGRGSYKVRIRQQDLLVVLPHHLKNIPVTLDEQYFSVSSVSVTTLS
jgi:hypothetical protein